MIYLETDSILKVVKRVYEQLFPTGLTPSDHDLEREDSATIVVEPRRTRTKEATSLSDGRLVYSHNYERFFPYAKDIDIPGDEDIVSFEMKFWNDDLVVPKVTAPKGRLQQVIDLLRSMPASRRAVIDLWDSAVHESSENAPCLTHIVFRVKDDVLEMHSHLRSNDICFLLFMDMQVMSGVHKIVADSLSLKKGIYVHFVDSLHFHKKNATLVQKQYAYMRKNSGWRNV
jgi:hypothetical protein